MHRSNSNLNELINENNKGIKFTPSEMLPLRRFHIGPAKTSKAVENLLEKELATIHSPKENVNVNKKHDDLIHTFYHGRERFPLNNGELDPETAVYETPIKDNQIGFQIDNVSTPPPRGFGVVADENFYGDNTNIVYRFSGGKSKRKTVKKKTIKPKFWRDMKPSKKGRKTYKKKYGSRCFLLPSQLKYPVCDKKTGKMNCKGLLSANYRAALSIRRKLKPKTYSYRKITQKARKLAKKHKCNWVKSKSKSKSKSKK